QTGPTLKVLALDTTGAQAPPAFAPPPMRARQNGDSPRIAPQPQMSATRKLLLDTQGRHRNLITILAAIFLLLLFLVATTVWVLQRRADRALATGEDNQSRLGVVEKSQDKTKQDVVDLAAGQAEHAKKLAEHAQRLNEAEGAVKELRAADQDL